MTCARCVFLAIGLGLLVGCSSRTQVQEEPAYDLLQDVNNLLHSAAGATGRPPAKLADLERYHKMYPRAYDAIKSGEVVVQWGGSPKGEGEVGKDESVLAYEKNVPTEGGYVLLSAGTVKKMSATEFAAAPKAGKK